MMNRSRPLAQAGGKTPVRHVVAWSIVLAGTLLLGTGPACAELRGVVHDPQGQPLPDVRVLLFEDQAQRLDPAEALASARTDEQGRFHLAAEPRDVILKLRGEDGAGRLRLSREQAGQRLELTYPVRSRIILLHDNDQHFNFHMKEAIGQKIQAYREQHANVFLLNAGDIFSRRPSDWEEPSAAYYAQRAAFMIQTMNDLGYDVMTLGNHELDYIEEHTRKVLERARFPLLAANVEANPRLPAFEPYTLLRTAEGYTIAVLGLSIGFSNGKDVRVTDRLAAADAYRHLGEAHDLFVALTHIGINADRELAEHMPELDVIVGGHSHTLLEEAELVGDVLVAQAGGLRGPHRVDPAMDQFLGRIKLVLENGRVVERSGKVYRFGPEQ